MLEVPSWEAGGSPSASGSAEMGACMKGCLAPVKTSFASCFLSSGRRSRGGFLSSLEALWCWGWPSPASRGWYSSHFHLRASEGVCIFLLLHPGGEKAPPGWQRPLVFLIAAQSIQVVSGVKRRARAELRHWVLLASS